VNFELTSETWGKLSHLTGRCLVFLTSNRVMHVPHGVTNTPHVTDEVSMCVAPTRARKSRALDRLSSTDLHCDTVTGKQSD
jgi:hypothetical protein